MCWWTPDGVVLGCFFHTGPFGSISRAEGYIRPLWNAKCNFLKFFWEFLGGVLGVLGNHLGGEQLPPVYLESSPGSRQA